MVGLGVSLGVGGTGMLSTLFPEIVASLFFVTELEIPDPNPKLCNASCAHCYHLSPSQPDQWILISHYQCDVEQFSIIELNMVGQWSVTFCTTPGILFH